MPKFLLIIYYIALVKFHVYFWFPAGKWKKIFDKIRFFFIINALLTKEKELREKLWNLSKISTKILVWKKILITAKKRKRKEKRKALRK